MSHETTTRNQQSTTKRPRGDDEMPMSSDTPAPPDGIRAKASRRRKSGTPAPTPPTPAERWHDADELRWAARHWATRIGVKTPRIQVRAMNRKWASISTAGRLTLNTDLLGVPKPLGEFVIVHELVHLLAPNHGRVFKSFLHAYLPDWQTRERALRAYAGEQKRPSNQLRRTPRPRQPGPSVPRRVTVLVVDDDQGIRDLHRSVMELEGYHVLTAEHGGPALEQMRASSEPLIVLLGLIMPWVNGEMVLRKVAADPALASRHRIIMVTGNVWAAEADPVAALRTHLDVPLIAKPVDLDALIDAVRQAEQSLGAS